MKIPITASLSQFRDRILAADRINGMMHISQLSWLAAQASVHHRILEVGCWRGRSTSLFCSCTPGKVTAVDTWNGAPELEVELIYLRAVSGDPDYVFHEFTANTLAFKNLEVIRHPSLEAAKLMSASNRTFDMIFLDGLHDHNNVVADIHAWFPLVEPGGMLCGHDLHFEGVASGVRECFPGRFPDKPDGDMWAVYR